MTKVDEILDKHLGNTQAAMCEIAIEFGEWLICNGNCDNGYDADFLFELFNKNK